jgi:hypothetical protein
MRGWANRIRNERKSNRIRHEREHPQRFSTRGRQVLGALFSGKKDHPCRICVSAHRYTEKPPDIAAVERQRVPMAMTVNKFPPYSPKTGAPHARQEPSTPHLSGLDILLDSINDQAVAGMSVSATDGSPPANAKLSKHPTSSTHLSTSSPNQKNRHPQTPYHGPPPRPHMTPPSINHLPVPLGSGPNGSGGRGRNDKVGVAGRPGRRREKTHGEKKAAPAGRERRRGRRMPHLGRTTGSPARLGPSAASNNETLSEIQRLCRRARQHHLVSPSQHLWCTSFSAPPRNPRIEEETIGDQKTNPLTPNPRQRTR